MMTMEEGGESTKRDDGVQIVKRKRTKRQRTASPATFSAGESPSENSTSFQLPLEEDEDMANCLILLAQGGRHESADFSFKASASSGMNTAKNSSAGEVYQCKTCDRSFPSFQALGGHRASHKKPKISEEQPGTVKKKPLAMVNEEESLIEEANTTLSLQIPSSSKGDNRSTTKTSKVHECAICRAEFSSGQALGGHMRRHRPFTSGSAGRLQSQQATKTTGISNLTLDLNLPAEPEESQEHDHANFHFASNKQVIVFSVSPLVGCQY